MDKFGSFYEEYNKILFNYLIRMTGDYHLASDITQESFTRFIERYKGKKHKTSLLFTIARNALFDHLRKEKFNTELDEDTIDRSRNQEYGLMIKQEYRHVISAMQSLKEDERDILSLAISDGLAYRDIASIIGISVENVKVKVHRARLKLKKSLQRGNES